MCVRVCMFMCVCVILCVYVCEPVEKEFYIVNKKRN